MSIRKIQGFAYHPYSGQSIVGQGYIGQRPARESLHLIWANYPESRGSQGSPSGEYEKRQQSEGDRRRIEDFEEIRSRYAIARYKRTEVTGNTSVLNILPFLYGLPLVAVSYCLLYVLHPDKPLMVTNVNAVIQLILLLAVMIPLHELVHAVSWSVFAKKHWKEIRLGFSADTLSPYCTCRRPLTRQAYVTGALMPLWFTGVIPTAGAVIFGSGMWLMLGIVMMMYAANDILKAVTILRYKGEGGSVFFMDYPDKEGGVIFESRKREGRITQKFYN